MNQHHFKTRLGEAKLKFGFQILQRCFRMLCSVPAVRFHKTSFCFLTAYLRKKIQRIGKEPGLTESDTVLYSLNSILFVFIVM